MLFLHLYLRKKIRNIILQSKQHFQGEENEKLRTGSFNINSDMVKSKPLKTRNPAIAEGPRDAGVPVAVSYTHLTLPTNREV